MTTKESTMQTALHTCVYMLCSPALFLQIFYAYNCPYGALLCKLAPSQQMYILYIVLVC